MFLSTVKAKGNFYTYLFAYTSRQNYSRTSMPVYRFGRKEIAIKKMRYWKEHFEEFPEELLRLGCNKADLRDWIKKLEAKITKSDTKIKEII